MPSIGTITVDLHTVDKNSVTYALAGNTVSHTDIVDLRRTMPTAPSAPLKANMRFERGFDTPATATTGLQKPVVVSIATTLPPGVDGTGAKAYVKLVLEQAAVQMSEMALTGDIHL